MMTRLHNQINISFLEIYSTLRRVKVVFANATSINKNKLKLISNHNDVTLLINNNKSNIPDIFLPLEKIRKTLNKVSGNNTHLLSIIQIHGEYGYFTPYKPHYKYILNDLAQNPENFNILSNYNLTDNFCTSLSSGDIRTSEVYNEKYSNKKMISIFMPIFANQHVVALAVVDLNSNFISSQVDSFNKENDTNFKLSKNTGKPLNIPFTTTQEYIDSPAITKDTVFHFLLCFVFSTLSTIIFDSYTKIKSVAFRDKLTGLHNRYYFQHKQRKLAHQCYTVILIDIDNFKSINDNYGHDTGDKILCGMVSAARNYVRKDDLFIRWGGEEFLILLYTNNINIVSERAEQIRSTIAKTPISGLNITASIELSTCSHQPFDITFNQADIALYQSKAQGKNKVTLFK